MANLGHIQQLLNTSGDYQQRFLKDPVAALEQQGLQLPFQMQQDIREQVRKASGKPPKTFMKFTLTIVLTTSY